MKRFKAGKASFGRKGIDINNDEMYCLCSRDYKEPKMVIEYEHIHDIIQSGHNTDNKIGGGGMTFTKKHCWDMIKVTQINDSTESGGKQPYQQNRIFDAEGLSPTIDQSAGRFSVKVKSATKKGFEKASEGDSINLTFPDSETRRGRVGVGQTLDTQCNQGVLIGKPRRTEEAKQIRKESLKNGKDYTPFQGKEMRFEESEEMNTITCATQKDNLLQQDYQIRRLTEIECERLQGFKDGHTAFGNYDGVIKPISKTNRYKMCGNAVTVDVVQLITDKLFNQL
jgi:DNA (cytosine-5)-methyltransferase 1